MKRKTLNVYSVTADTSAIRTETHNGVEYMVVPVVALVEGVLQGANSANAELALSEEFGKFPEGWNGRPLVMGHPKVNGQFVPANSPTILEDWAFGQIFNTTLEGDKLKTEAWIDLARVQAKGGEFQDTVNRLNAGAMVEISTGLMSSIEQIHGYWNGEKYFGVWRNVVPDHLAFLSEGSIGACSVEGGCGAPRINTRPEAQSLNLRIHHAHTRAQNSGLEESSSSQTLEAIGTCSCGCGGACSDKGDSSMATPNVNNTNNTNTNAVVLNAEGRSHEEQIAHLSNALMNATQCIQTLQVNSYPSDMPVNNVGKLLDNALRSMVDLFYVYTFTQDTVVYERWDSMKIFSREYSIDANNQVTIGDTETEVMMLSKIVDVTPATSDATIQANEAGEGSGEEGSSASETATGEEQPKQQETTMAKEDENNVSEETVETAATATGEPATQENTEVEETAAAAAPVQANAAPKRPLSVQEYIQDAPAEIQEVLSEGLKLHNNRRNKMVKDILANKSNAFSEEALKGMNMTTLESVHKLASTPTVVTNNYGGRAIPRDPQASEEVGAPRAMEAFPRKTQDQAS